MRVLGITLVLAGVATSVFAGAPPAAPEIDGASVMSAVALLAGGVLVLRSRRKK